jgi:hypothetical protein
LENFARFIQVHLEAGRDGSGCVEHGLGIRQPIAANEEANDPLIGVYRYIEQIHGFI